MPFEVETVTTVKWKPVDGRTDNSRFLIIRENGNLAPLIGAADWTDYYPNYRLCLARESWPEEVSEVANELLIGNSATPEDAPRLRALILSELKVGSPAIRIGLAHRSFYHGLGGLDLILEGTVTGFEVID